MKHTETHRELLVSLFGELRQTERSAEVHCAREARRLDGAPREALLAVSSHAAEINRQLPDLLRTESLPEGGLGRRIGSLLSTIREVVADRLIDRERSYRATLLGLRHGADVIRMIRHVADASGRVEIGGFCARWLHEREPLVGRVEHAMSWFSHHPEDAIEAALPWRALRRRPPVPA